MFESASLKHKVDKTTFRREEPKLRDADVLCLVDDSGVKGWSRSLGLRLRQCLKDGGLGHQSALA